MNASTPARQALERELLRAEQLCTQRGVRLTPQRREVLELVLAAGRPVGAYELLDRLRERGHGGGPPTVYRALGFLQEQGLVHRLASSNSYVACAHPGDGHDGLIFVCGECGEAVETEVDAVSEAVERKARKLGYRLPHEPIEVRGTCRRCQEARQ
jgi:Fur family zinc uptake transcriptional regulator